MFFPTKILLATDGSGDAALAARAAVDLSIKTGSELHVVHVWRDLPRPSHDRQGEATRRSLLHELVARELVEEQKDRLETLGASVTRIHLREGELAEEIARLGEEIDAGLLMLGSRGLGAIARLVLGSVSEKVVYTANRPVLAVRGGATAWPPKRVVVGDDSSDPAKRAAMAALSIGKLFGAEAILVRTAYPPSQSPPPGHPPQPPPPWHDPLALQRERDVVARMLERRRIKKALQRHAGELEDAVGLQPNIRTAGGDAAACILEAAEEGGEEATLVAVGSRGLGGMKSTFLGSVSRKVLRVANGPVLVVP